MVHGMYKWEECVLRAVFGTIIIRFLRGTHEDLRQLKANRTAWR